MPAEGSLERQNPPLPLLLLTAVAALAGGYVVLELVQWLVHALWFETPERFDGPLLWLYFLAMPTLAGVVVAWLRRRANGHSPLDGFTFAPVPAKAFPFLLFSILATLAGGLVLGPEVALITTGSFIATLLSRWAPAASRHRLIVLGGVFGILALVVNPLLTDSQRLAPSYEFSWTDLGMAVVVAAAAATAGAGVRWLALKLRARTGPEPRTAHLAAAGFIVGALAILYVQTTDQQVYLVLTSGEGAITTMVTLTSAWVIVATVVIKMVAYTLSLAVGFRGGPYFPIFILGVGVGTLISTTGWVAIAAAGTAGLIATTTNLTAGKWPLTIVVSAGLGWLVGGPALMPVALLGGIIGRLIPKPMARASEQVAAH